MERTLENCSLIKKIDSQPVQYNGKCEGFQGDTDEPCEICKNCELNVWHEE